MKPGWFNEADIKLMELTKRMREDDLRRNPRLDVSSCCEFCIRRMWPNDTCPRDRGLPCD